MKKVWWVYSLVLAACSTDKTLSTEEQLAKMWPPSTNIGRQQHHERHQRCQRIEVCNYRLRFGGCQDPTLANGISVKYVGKLMSTGVAFDSHPTTAVNFGTLAGLICGGRLVFTQFEKRHRGDTLHSFRPWIWHTGFAASDPGQCQLDFDVTLVDEIMKSLCFATNNMHKLEEVRAALGETFRIVTPGGDRMYD